MAKRAYELRTIIRKRSAGVLGPEAVVCYCHLGEHQPLVLVREPNNPNHSAAVLCTDLMGAPCGYVAREHAPEVAAKMDSGQVLLCRTVGPCRCDYRRILIWSDGEEVSEGEIAEKKKERPRERELEPTVPKWGQNGNGT